MSDSGSNQISRQIDYYRARAPEYDDWFERRGRYDLGEEGNAGWFREVEEVQNRLRNAAPTGDVLELAAGTGWWTEQLARLDVNLTAVDASSEVLGFNRKRVDDCRVAYLQEDLFSWRPSRKFDFVFFGFWLSHVPEDRFASFWEMVANALRPGGRVFFVDSLYAPEATARDHQLRGPEATTVGRRLDDGREFEIVKIFHRPQSLARRLQEMGWSVRVETTERYFLIGLATRGT